MTARPASRVARRGSRAGLATAPRRARRRGEHAPDAAGPRPVQCAIVTVSDTRRGADDLGGALLARMLTGAGHAVASRGWVRDEVAAIRKAARAALAKPAIDTVLVTGGTGPAHRDVTPEALAPLFEKRLDGFGELFRMRSWSQVGAAAWFSRAGAGIAKGRLLVMLPGSMRALELAMNELLLPELVHVMRTLGRFPNPE